MSYQLYLYKFTDAARDYPYTNAEQALTLDGITYAPSSVSHSTPTFSSDPSQARITVSLRDDLDVAMNYISHPPPYRTELTIYEVLALSGLTVTHADHYWAGQLVRVAWRDSFRVAELTCRTLWDMHSSKETMQASLHPLCRFHTGDGRCPVNIEDFKESATVTAVSADISEPTITVDTLAQVPDTYYRGGMVRLADGDMRTVDKCETVGGDRVLTISRAFPSSSLQTGEVIEVFAGDDLTLEVCSTVFGSQTDSGRKWGGWKLTPNRDYQKYGLR